MDGGTCKQDGERTRLTCAQCLTPICPHCLVRTPVGMKCRTCGGPGKGPSRGRRGRWLLPAGVALLAVAALLLPRLGSSPTDPLRDPGLLASSGAVTADSRPVRIGEATRDSDLVMVVSAFDCGATSVSGRAAQGRFCFLTVALRNVGEVPAVFVATAQMLADPLARRFGPDPSATAAHPSNAGRDLASLVVNPGNEVAGVLVYDVPPDVTPTAAALRANPAGAGAVVSLTARA
ncbi:MAG: DUF4352 domain-containing protein [Acidimicrobiales bacterium]